MLLFKANGEAFEKALETALEVGYRHIDTAHAYDNEAIIGRVLQRWFNSGKLKRKFLIFIISFFLVMCEFFRGRLIHCYKTSIIWKPTGRCSKIFQTIVGSLATQLR